MSPITRAQFQERNVGKLVDPPKRRRLRASVNKDVSAGRKNCQNGICRKANNLFLRYNVEIALLMRTPDGHIGGYQSKPGLAQELFRNDNVSLLLPQSVEQSNYHALQRQLQDAWIPSRSPTAFSVNVAEIDQTLSQNLPINSATESDATLSGQENGHLSGRPDEKTPLDFLAEAALLESPQEILEVTDTLGSKNGDAHYPPKPISQITPQASDDVIQPTLVSAWKGSFIRSLVKKFTQA